MLFVVDFHPGEVKVNQTMGPLKDRSLKLIIEALCIPAHVGLFVKPYLHYKLQLVICSEQVVLFTLVDSG